MNVEEIVKRPNGSEYSVEELAFVVEQYIFKLKGRVVKINLKKGIRPNPFDVQLKYPRQVELLNMAFERAQYYFRNFVFI